MKIETCSLCEETICRASKRGRTVIQLLTGRTTSTNVPIEKCTTREAHQSYERLDLMELEDKHGLAPTILLGC